MANEEHVKILKQGVEVWNRWRIDNPNVQPDLCDLSIKRARLNGANLTNTNLNRAILRYGEFREVRFENAIMDEASLSGSDLTGVSFQGVQMKRAYLVGARLRGAFLQFTNLSHSDLSKVDLQDSKLFRSILDRTNLSEANLSNATVSSVLLRGTILDKVDLSYSTIRGLVLDKCDLSTFVGLNTVKHSGPSTVGIETIYLSKGKIPEAFLRGCGVPNTFITFARSLINAAIDFYSCFISYSSKNQAFAERLYADLQSRGVRCWFAPEDIKIGDNFRQRIDESIRVHDKLLLILSEQSISSPWVEEEVESAFELERKEKRLVLFPVRIDDAVMGSDQTWAASLRRMRHIGDFSRWKEHDLYRKAFDRLLRDLKAEAVKE